jgi:hypothetical protein
MNDADKIVLIEKYLAELQERIEIRYQGTHEDKRVGYGYVVVKADLEQVMAGTYEFTEDSFQTPFFDTLRAEK